jgi:hypothetical protein
LWCKGHSIEALLGQLQPQSVTDSGKPVKTPSSHRPACTFAWDRGRRMAFGQLNVQLVNNIV